MSISPHSDVTPQDTGAEKAVLGAILLKPSRLVEIVALGLQGHHFFRHAHELIYRAYLELIDDPDSICPQTVAARLGRKAVDEVGGPAYLTSLTDGLPHNSALPANVGLILDAWQGRQIEKQLGAALTKVRLGEVSQALDLLDSAVALRRAGSPANVVNALDLKDLAPPEPVIKEWPILGRGNLIGIVGASGVGKSFLCVRIAMECARQGRRVGYVALEGLRAMEHRLEAARLAFGIETEALRNVNFVDHIRLGDSADVQAVAAAFGNADLIIIDTFGRSISDLDENSASHVGKALNSCGVLARQQNAPAVIVVHHTNRASSSERGSSAFRAGLDVLAFLEDRGETLSFKVEKFRDGLIPPTREFELSRCLVSRSLVLLDAEDTETAKTEEDLSPKTQDVLAAVREAGKISVPDLLRALEGRVGRSVVYGALKELKRMGLLREARRSLTPIEVPAAVPGKKREVR